MKLGRFIFGMICLGLVFIYAMGFAQEEEYSFRGIHYLASYKDCDAEALSDIERLSKALVQACDASGATVLNYSSHLFPSNGFTMVVLLSESHASIHTYPEWRACFVDLFTCGTNCSYQEFEKVLVGYLKPRLLQPCVADRQ